ncbi:MAG: ATP-binding protein [Geminicoccaceae bacterium]
MSASAGLNRTTFTTSRLLEFCSSKELTAQTGHEPDDWPLVIIKELVDNALDACEEAGVAPVIHVTVARGKIRVRDNGPGIPPETVASILDFTTRTSSREAYVAPDRGRQGNAGKTIVAMPFALSGEEGRVEIVARGIRHEITFTVDRIAQEPVIDHQRHRLEGTSVRSGTTVTVHWPESSWSDLEDVGRHFLPMVERFAHLNPHLTMYATWADRDRFDQHERLTRRATAPDYTKWTPASPTCPHWYRRAELERLIGAFLTHDRQHKSVRLLRDFLAEFHGLAGTAKRKVILDAVGLQRAPLERLLLDGSSEFDRDLVERLLAAMQATARPVKPGALGPLGEANVRLSFERYGADLSTFSYKVLKGVGAGVPWLAEAAFAYRPPDSNRRALLCGINWSPALRTQDDPFGLGAQLSENYCYDSEPVVVLAHLICPRPEFRDRGKSSLAWHSPGFTSIREAVATVTAAWSKQRKSEIRNTKLARNRLERMQRQQVREVSLKDLVLRYLPRVIPQVSDDGRLSFTQRDLFYAVRPLVQQEHDKPIKYSYFKALLTDIEAEQGEIAGLLREPRGSLYHPHLRQTIPLSTESVAAYRRPFWTFNKIVYIEKAGTQKNLIETGWPEEHDCAIANTGGYTTRAVKDLFDLLATSSEPVTVFCAHDADAAGTMIYHTLINETKARGARKIEVVNLGLEPWEGVALGLEIEEVEGTDRNRPVAPYVAEHDGEWRSWLAARDCDSWAGWLQSYRIELNAMLPGDRIAWMTGKIEQYPPRKVIPPEFVLHTQRVSAARGVITEELLERARIDERTKEILDRIEWRNPHRTSEVTRRYLERPGERRESWTRPMSLAGKKLAKRTIARLDAKDEMP